MTMSNTDDYLRINELKNYLYCPRISYYGLCLRLDRETHLSSGGIRAEASTKEKMKRRKGALHAIHAGEREFDVLVVHEGLRLIGRLDEVVRTAEGVYLVDYKDTDKDYGYWGVQMMAYRLGMEASGEQVLGSSIYSIPKQSYTEVKPTSRQRQQLEEAVQALAQMVAMERCPAATDHCGKCQSCQYARFCNDVF
ncbi:MAG: CRISPR-associated protein Cas4 [Anaerolineae bacterium]|nr:CRISPR-associated protein Cas4 [Anaerolineae bacterium]